MHFPDVIERKKTGGRLAAGEVRDLIAAYTGGRVPDYQMAALLMAIRWRGLDDDEVVALTHAMAASGERYDWSDLGVPTADKHSTGGVGDKASLVVAPLVAAAGCAVPMVSGRGLGHTGGTLDKLESIPGLTTTLDAATFRRQVERLGVALGGQSERFVPADRRLYALRDVTSTVDDSGLITASILSKKLAEGTGALVLDVKCGSGAFFAKLDDARALARRLQRVAGSAGLRCTALITDMEQPLGCTIGNQLEVFEAVRCLRGEGPADLTELAFVLGAEMLCLAGVADDMDSARTALTRVLESGAGLEKLRAVVDAQGGDVEFLDRHPSDDATVRSQTLTGTIAGSVRRLDALSLARAAIALGAGRTRKEDRIDPAAGVVVTVKPGDRLEAGQDWATLYYHDGADVDRAAQMVQSALSVAATPPEPRPLILERHA